MKKNKFRIFGVSVVVLAAIAAGIGGWYFMAGGNSYENVFYPGTTLNQMNVEGMTVDEVTEQLKTLAKDYTLSIAFKNEQVTLKGTDMGVAYNEAADIQGLKDQQNQTKAAKTEKADLNLELNNLFTYDSAAIKKQLDQCSAMDQTKMIAPENAQLVYDKNTNT